MEIKNVIPFLCLISVTWCRSLEVEVIPTKPPHELKALTARFVTHISDWGSLATISSHDPIKGFPFAKVMSISDGVKGKNSTGIPYMFLTPLDVSAQDIMVDSRVSLSLSEAQSDICESGSIDPQSPLCAKVIITGNVVKVTDAKEKAMAKRFLDSRHPEMAFWPQDFFYVKLDILQVQMLDWYGGITTLTPERYFEANLY